MEHLLGASPETVEQPADRQLSIIELELAVTVFEKIANANIHVPPSTRRVVSSHARGASRSQTRQGAGRQTGRIRGRDQHVDHALGDYRSSRSSLPRRRC